MKVLQKNGEPESSTWSALGLTGGAAGTESGFFGERKSVALSNSLLSNKGLLEGGICTVFEN